MTTSSERYEAAERRQRAVLDLKELYDRVFRKLGDGRPEEVGDLCDQVVAAADALGDSYTTTEFPVCFPCTGLAEIPHPEQSDRRALCRDFPRACHGNRFGRMHPIHLRDYVAGLVAGKRGGDADASEALGSTGGDGAAGGGDGGRVDPGAGTPPNPAPGPDPRVRYVYSRDAVIEFNRGRAERGEPLIPPAAEDEKVLAHADGTYTVRKVGSK